MNHFFRFFRLFLVLTPLISCKSSDIAKDSAMQCAQEVPLNDLCLAGVEFDGTTFNKVESILKCPLEQNEDANECSSFGKIGEQDPPPPWPPDACGCDGKTCPDGQSCRLEVFDLKASCPGPPVNQCFVSCSNHQDCEKDELCIPGILNSRKHNQCKKVSCKTDADCTELPCGKCIVERYYESQCFTRAFRGTACYYQGDRERNSK